MRNHRTLLAGLVSGVGPNSLAEVDPQWAWQTYQPQGNDGWNVGHVAHLYQRAGFAANWQELQTGIAAGPEQTLALLLDGGPDTSAFYNEMQASLDALVAAGDPRDLAGWWLYVMIHTPHPMLEKLTLFWHGHFATSAAKVTSARLMRNQIQILRTHALAPFGPMLEAVSKDPAMLVWLDSVDNRKAHPNENFAREVMELFSLGLGNYTEDDIKQAARAFTGWEMRRDKFRINPRQHDDGSKSLLGQTGNFDGDDVIRILLAHPATGKFLVRKLFRYYVSESSDVGEALLEPLVEEYRQSAYDTKQLLRRMLGSNLFFSPLAHYQRIKPPVDFSVSLLRALEGTTNSYTLAKDLELLGQSVCYPPNVKGWDGGLEWINSSTLLSRANLAWAMIGGKEPSYGAKVDLAKLAEKHGCKTPADRAKLLAQLLLPTGASEELLVQLTAIADASGEEIHAGMARVVQGIATLPEFQLS